MYESLIAGKKEIYLPRFPQTSVISASEFREKMFCLHRLHLQPYSENQRQIIVRNFKEQKDMFVVLPIWPAGDIESLEFTHYVLSEMEQHARHHR